MAGYRSLQHGAKTLFLRGRLALLWGVQVAVFPAYVAFQSIRTGYRRLQSKHPWQALNGLLTGKPVQEIPVTADTPIRALLSAIQPQMSPKAGWLRPVNYHGAFLRQSHAGGVLTNGSWHLVPVKEPIRGIASDVVTRKLVLVTADNAVFKELTEDQRSRLENAIALLLAEYAAQQRQRELDQDFQRSGLPLPKVEPTQWPVVRWLHRTMRWMQTSGLAVVTNLFGEAEQRERLLLHRAPRMLAKPFTSADPAILPAPEESYWLNPKAFIPEDVVATEFKDDITKCVGSPLEVLREGSISDRLEGQLVPNRGCAVKPHSQGPAVAQMTESDWPAGMDTVEAQVSRVVYIDRWFVQLLRWVDQGLHWLEQVVQQFWKWLRKPHR